MEEEDDLLQFAIQQSLIEAGTEKEEASKLLIYYIVIVLIFLG